VLFVETYNTGTPDSNPKIIFTFTPAPALEVT
jgi:hypothetical protein